MGINREYTPGRKLKSKQEGQLRVLDALGKKYGLTIVAQDQIEGGKANGKYEDGTIYVALDAMEDAYVYVGVHEAVHYIEDVNPDEYAILRDYVLEREQANGLDLEARIAQRMEKEGLTREGAISEIVADAVPSVFTNAKNVRELVGINPKLVERIRDWLAEFISDIKNSISRLGKYGGRYEIAALEKDTEALEIYTACSMPRWKGRRRTWRAGMSIH